MGTRLGFVNIQERSHATPHDEGFFYTATYETAVYNNERENYVLGR